MEETEKFAETMYENIHTCKTFLRKIKQDMDKWRDISCSWIRKFNIVGISVLPKLIYGFNAVAIKILMGVFVT